MKILLALLLLGWLSGCGINLTYLQSEPLAQPAPVEQRLDSVATPLSSPASPASPALTHRVVSGDTLYAIARRYQHSLANLAVWNQLAPPYTLQPGQVLRVSSSVAAGNSALPVPKSTPAPALLARPAAHDQTPTRRVSPDFYNLTRQSFSPPVNTVQASCTPLSGAWHWPSLGQIETTFTRTGRRGINIFGQLNQPILATAAGQVIYSGVGVNGYESNLIIIQHNPMWMSVYSHTRNRRVGAGQQVYAGQAIADMGLDLQQRAMLHFELSCNEKTVNPLLYLPPR